MHIRDKGRNTLAKVITNKQDISTIQLIENAIYDITTDDYLMSVYQAVYDIRMGISPDSVLASIKNKKIGMEHAMFADEKHEEEEQNNFILHPFEVNEGVLTCKCGSKRVYSYQKQTRSADEPMTTFATCMACKFSWTYSG